MQRFIYGSAQAKHLRDARAVTIASRYTLFLTVGAKQKLYKTHGFGSQTES